MPVCSSSARGVGGMVRAAGHAPERARGIQTESSPLQHLSPPKSQGACTRGGPLTFGAFASRLVGDTRCPAAVVLVGRRRHGGQARRLLLGRQPAGDVGLAAGASGRRGARGLLLSPRRAFQVPARLLRPAAARVQREMQRVFPVPTRMQHGAPSQTRAGPAPVPFAKRLRGVAWAGGWAARVPEPSPPPATPLTCARRIRRGAGCRTAHTAPPCPAPRPRRCGRCAPRGRRVRRRRRDGLARVSSGERGREGHAPDSLAAPA